MTSAVKQLTPGSPLSVGRELAGPLYVEQAGAAQRINASCSGGRILPIGAADTPPHHRSCDLRPVAWKQQGQAEEALTGKLLQR